MTSNKEREGHESWGVCVHREGGGGEGEGGWVADIMTLRPDVSVSVSFFFFLFPARYHVWGRDHVCVFFLFLFLFFEMLSF